MQFTQVMAGVETLSMRGDAQILGIAYDSRKVRPGFLFIAMRGESSDGNRFIDAAIRAGATAVVSDSNEALERGEIALARVPHGRRAMAGISANFYAHPAEKLKLTGVTGTNGKTTTTFLIEHILQKSERSAAM